MHRLEDIKHNMEKYESIINMPYQKSTKRKHMSLNDRAAQFAPFAALTGYEESIKEVSRTTDKKIRQKRLTLCFERETFFECD